MSPAETVFGFIAFEAAEVIELGDARGLQRAVELDDADQFAATERALEDARNGDAPEKVAVVEIGHLHLQHGLRIAGGRRHGADDGLEQRRKILGIVSA